MTASEPRPTSGRRKYGQYTRTYAMTDEFKAELLAEYETSTIREIAVKRGNSYATVHRWLELAGVEFRTRGGRTPRTSDPVDEEQLKARVAQIMRDRFPPTSAEPAVTEQYVRGMNPADQSPALLARLRTLYEVDMLSTRQIVDRTGIGRTPVRAMLKAAGTNFRPVLEAARPDPELLADVRRRYDAGHSTRRIARDIGASPRSVARWVAATGPLRPGPRQRQQRDS